VHEARIVSLQGLRSPPHAVASYTLQALRVVVVLVLARRSRRAVGTSVPVLARTLVPLLGLTAPAAARIARRLNWGRLSRRCWVSSGDSTLTYTRKYVSAVANRDQVTAAMMA
jgi:hypothetical protein